MKFIANTFLKGLLALLPLLLTVYGTYHFFRWLNEWTNALLKLVFAGAPDLPGLGMVVGAAFIFALGLLVSSTITRRLYELIEIPFNQVPIIRDLYSALKQLAAFFGPAGDRHANQVVRIRHPDLEIEMIGLMTRSNLSGLPAGITQDERVAVYLPMSYQIGGYTLFVPRSWVEPLDLSAEAAMRESLTGWLEHPER